MRPNLHLITLSFKTDAAKAAIAERVMNVLGLAKPAAWRAVIEGIITPEPQPILARLRQLGPNIHVQARAIRKVPDEFPY
jgi:hypothetical protein